MSNLMKNGTLVDATPLVVIIGGMEVPMTATLASAAAGRMIELSSDGGVNYYQPALGANTVPLINVAIMAPVSHVRFTGAAADKWSVR